MCGLSTCTSSNTTDFSNINMTEVKPFIPPISSGFVVKVYDGDTITIISKLPYEESSFYKFSVRLNGIDCPEIKGETLQEKQCAQLARDELSQLILNKEIILKNLKTEKYGRILADVYLDDLHLNQYMLDKKLAVKYDGGTKTKSF
jgi:endonuclease YncB( thermonuclease family)